ncbi:MAG: Nin-like protein [Comamonadaceae bacterium]|nr:MAG: Nin-like protein [Comamonadaceae bacterium]
MHDPFRLTGPTCLSFSGGSTSGYMLWRTLQSNTVADLKRWLRVAFANTGLEHPKTLKFVDDTNLHWLRPLGLAIDWVEFRDDEAGHAVVTYETASREGEPFLALVKKRNYPPNPITRFCTSELKIHAMHKRLRALGWCDENAEWDQFIGIRADEPRRVAKIRARGTSTETSKETMCMPLADAGVGVAAVDDFWAKQPFQLELPRHKGRTLAGNCVLCFLKPRKQVESLMASDPSYAVVWIKMENDTVKTIKPNLVETGFFDADGEPLLKEVIGLGARFRKDWPTYEQMLHSVLAQADAFGHEPVLVHTGLVDAGGADILRSAQHDEEGIACFCGD